MLPFGTRLSIWFVFGETEQRLCHASLGLICVKVRCSRRWIRVIPKPLVRQTVAERRLIPGRNVPDHVIEPEPSAAAPARQPVFNIPGPVTAVLAVLFLVHIVRQLIPDAWDDAVFSHLAFVPGRLTFVFDRDRVIGAMMTLAAQGSEGYRQATAGRFFLDDGSVQPWTLVTYALLHADWTHVGLNGVWLLAFGTPVARRTSSRRFLSLLGTTALAGAVVQYLAHPLDLAPVIGASAAVSGCMGATLRFMFQPRGSRVAMLGAASETPRPGYLAPVQPLRALVADRRAMTFLIAWFGTNLLFGLGSIGFGLSSGPIAWQAHIGGFCAGLLLFPLFDAPSRARHAAIEGPAS